MSLPRYPVYKDSGVEWLGEVPAHWNTKPVKRGFSRQKKLNTGMACENRLSLTLAGVVPRSLHDLDGLQASEFETYQLFERNDLVFKLIDLQNIKTSRVGIVPEAGIMSPAYIRLRPSEESVSPKYGYWFFTDLYNRCIFNQMGDGVRQTIGQDELLGMAFCYPTLVEQTAIVTFLDRETAKIDGLIAEQEKLIALLAEKRQATISHAVTKGLNSAASMKDSGVAWLGDIPSHWKLNRGRFLFSQSDDPPEVEDGVVTAFRDGQVTLRENRRTDGFTLAVLEAGYQHVKEGDLVIHGMDAFAGAIGVSESNGKCTPEYSVLRGRGPGLSNNYFAAVLRIMAKRNFIYVICPSVRERAPRFRYASFKDVLLPHPPIEEQMAIVQHISNEVRRIEKLLKIAAALVSLLGERRSALISAAVTGKIDVRHLAEKEAA